MIYELEFYPEECCELCMDVIHNHFECPICKDDYASTDIYGDLLDYVKKYGDEVFCEECKSGFKWVDGNSPYSGKWELFSVIH